MGLGETNALIEQYRSDLRGDPTNLFALISMCDALAAQGKAGQVAAEIEGWALKLPPESRGTMVAIAEAAGFYRAGKLDLCIKACEKEPMLRSSSLMAQAMAASGRARDAAADTTLEAVWQDPWSTLAEAVALAVEGRAEDAGRWRERAAKALKSKGPDFERAAAVLTAAAAPSKAELDQIGGLEPEDRAILLVALGQKFPSLRAGCLAEAKRLMVSHEPPYALIRLVESSR
jgi:hypothetical protein